MVLLDAVARMPLTRGAAVAAVFDHGTGRTAAAAAQFVADQAAERGLPCVIGSTAGLRRTEADWRAGRWKFLLEVAAAEDAEVATAHTRDDQVETVVIRALRDAGARGLAGLYAPSETRRPLLTVSRADVAEYAGQRGVRFIEDPTNRSRRHLRNRVRLDLLPAIAQVRPQFAGEMLAVARRAAAWRFELARLVDGLDVVFLDRGTIRIAAGSLHGYDAASLRILWPEVAARAGVTMDRRGTERAAAFTIERIAALRGAGEGNRPGVGAASLGGRGRVIQLSGGAEIEQIGGAFVLRRR